MRLKKGILAIFCMFLLFSLNSMDVFPSKKSPLRIKKVLVLKKAYSSALKKSLPGNVPWAEIKVIFDSKFRYIDKLTVKYYVLVRNRKSADVLYKEITYLDVLPGKGYISSVFIHPSTMVKYSNRIESVHCEFWHSGRLLAAANFPNNVKIRWWDKKPGKKGYLFSKYFTPFAIDPEYHVLLEQLD